MKRMKLNLLTVSTILGSCVMAQTAVSAEVPTPESVKAITKRVADWQIETFEESEMYRALSVKNRKKLAESGKRLKKWHDLEWHMGALYAGMYEWSTVSGDPKYADWLTMIGERNDWKLHWRKYFADDHAVGQFYLSLYEDTGRVEMLKPTRKQFDWILENPKTGTLEYSGYGKKTTTDWLDRWGWCDALFMGPPVWARLAKITGDQKYLDFMDQEYHATYDFLWDKEEALFWRDSSYFERREDNGRKLFWSRGNGWVFGGLALMIPDLPEDWEGRAFYIDLYKQMAESLRAVQRPDGTWSMGLLGGVDGYPIKETSGTAFYTFGYAWGINNCILDRAEYAPVVLKAWQALTECVTDEGLLGYVQPVGAAPGDSFADKTEVYGIGAFLAAGTEVYKLLQPGRADQVTATNVELKTFMEGAGWCWYQDPRAIVHGGNLFIGAVVGNGTGAARVGVYDLVNDQPLGNVLMQDHFNRDDHNSPVFHVRKDGSVLATYAKHNSNKFHYSRISDPTNPLNWSAEMKHERISPNPQDRVTYMNLYAMEDEGKLYNFYRGIEFNPTFVTSTDEGKTWAEPVHFFKNEVGGRHRPYARYAGNGSDTVYVSITDAHPRVYGNSLYYFEFRDGNYYKADGTLIKNLATDGALLPSEAEKVFVGSEQKRGGKGGSASRSAWTSSIAIDSKGYPHIGYTLYLSNEDHRYRIASWDGQQWYDREVAYAGNCLYMNETSYTGLIALDPVDPSVVFISTDVNPNTGEDLGGQHEIYRANVTILENISTIEWEAVTTQSAVSNLRPAVLREGDQRIVVWNRGMFNTYVDYDLDAVGFVETVR